jgi:hypothetical protein
MKTVMNFFMTYNEEKLSQFQNWRRRMMLFYKKKKLLSTPWLLEKWYPFFRILYGGRWGRKNFQNPMQFWQIRVITYIKMVMAAVHWFQPIWELSLLSLDWDYLKCCNQKEKKGFLWHWQKLAMRTLRL